MGWYNKSHLVPFAEFFPVPSFVRSWLRLMNLPYSDFTHGASHQAPLGAAGLKLLATICYEDGYGASQLDEQVENLLVGWRGYVDTRDGKPHWTHGVRLEMQLDHFGASKTEALAFQTASSDAPEFTRYYGAAVTGFSFMRDGPLDMRMDPTRGRTAAELLQTLTHDELTACFLDLGDVQQSARVKLNGQDYGTLIMPPFHVVVDLV